MDFSLHNLNDHEFERLVGTICSEILGTGVVVFSKGKDGGRDGKFEGTAEKYPSSHDPWSGKFIVQCKHTSNPIASCSDNMFKLEIDKEIKKIKKLSENKEVDNYLIFTNRKYTGIAGENLLNHVKTETGLKNVAIIGKETLNDIHIAKSPQIIREFKLNKNIIEFDFNENDFRFIIENFKNQLKLIEPEIRNVLERIEDDFYALDLDTKNELNNLSKEYFESSIVEHSLSHFTKIELFLKSPQNEEILEAYNDLVNELREVINIHRNQFHCFEEIFDFIYKRINWSGDSEFRGKRYITILLHYMYFCCEIGKKNA
jgi:hypothetical protein